MSVKQQKILNSAKALFTEQGFKKTKISDIMSSAGMADGTFYNYYESKEALFMTLYNEENVKLKNNIIESIDLSGHPTEVMQRLMVHNEAGMKSNPILKEWYNPDVATKMERYFAEHEGMNQMQFLQGHFIEVIESWQKDGKMRNDISSEVIMTMFTGLIVLESHKNEVGSETFDEAFMCLSEFVMDGLTRGRV